MAAKSKTAKSKAGNPKTGKSVKGHGRYDWGLMTIVISLLSIGIVMVFSSSFNVALRQHSDPFYFFLRQLSWTAIGVFALVIMASIRYTLWEQWSIALMAAALLGLLVVLPFGATEFGATRTLFSGSVQPSEPAKIAIIIYISTWLASKGVRIRDVRVGLIPFSVLMGLISVLIVFQPDISTAFLIVTTAMILFFIAGADLKQLLFMAVVTTLTFVLVIQNSDYASARVDKYVGSFDNPLGSEEFQVQRMVSALINGGPVGSGIGQGETYVPLGWSDNIFAVIGEEMGMFGALLIIFLFALFAYCGLRTALRAPDDFGMLLALGITCLLVLQAILNAAVVVAIAPPTGVTLPFISYGGSSLVTTLAAVGILLSIGKYSGESLAKPSELGNMAYARFDFGWWNGGARISSSGSRRTTKASKSKAGSSAKRSSSQRSSSQRSAKTKSRPATTKPSRTKKPATQARAKSNAGKAGTRKTSAQRSRSSG